MAEIKKVSISSGNTAVFVCPECNKAKSVDVSKYKKIDKVVKVKAKCVCGYSYTAILDKRRYYRKETNLYGVYSNLASGKKGQKGQMTVINLSRSGLKLKISPTNLKIRQHGTNGITEEEAAFDHNNQKPVPDLNVGDKLLVEFHLDDGQRSLIRKEVAIVWINIPYIGVKFCHEDLYDADLGFYLLA